MHEATFDDLLKWYDCIQSHQYCNRCLILLFVLFSYFDTGNDLLVCPKMQTCCTPLMEKYLIQAADRNFIALLNTTANQFPQQLKKQLQNFMRKSY